MTRSYRKPYRAFVCYSPLSMRQYKRIRAGQERARAKDAIRNGLFDIAEKELAPWDDWECPTDGQKRYDEDVKWSRK